MPAVSNALKNLIALLDLEELEVNIFRGVSPKEDRQRVFGGQVCGHGFSLVSRGLVCLHQRDKRRSPAMDIEDLEPTKKKPTLRNLEIMSIEALGDYIEELKSEIARVETEIAHKRSARAGAESVFKK